MLRLRRMVTTGLAVAVIGGVGAVAMSANGASAAPSTASLVNAAAASVSDAAVAKQLGGRISSITALDASSITVKSKSGTSTTYTVNGDTKYLAPPAVPLTLSFLRVGDHVVVVPTAKGSTVAKAVHVLIAHIAGKVTAVTPTSITVTGPKGKVQTFAVSSSTVYKSAGDTVTASAVTVGKVVVATGRITDGTLQALQVNVGDKGSAKKLRQRMHDRVKHWREQHGGAGAPAPANT